MNTLAKKAGQRPGSIGHNNREDLALVAKNLRKEHEERYRGDLRSALQVLETEFIELCSNGRFAPDGITCKVLQRIPGLGCAFGTYEKGDTITTSETYKPFEYELNPEKASEYKFWLRPKATEGNPIYYNKKKNKRYVCLPTPDKAHVILVEEAAYKALLG